MRTMPSRAQIQARLEQQRQRKEVKLPQVTHRLMAELLHQRGAYIKRKKEAFRAGADMAQFSTHAYFKVKNIITTMCALGGYDSWWREVRRGIKYSLRENEEWKDYNDDQELWFTYNSNGYYFTSDGTDAHNSDVHAAKVMFGMLNYVAEQFDDAALLGEMQLLMDALGEEEVELSDIFEYTLPVRSETMKLLESVYYFLPSTKNKEYGETPLLSSSIDDEED